MCIRLLAAADLGILSWRRLFLYLRSRFGMCGCSAVASTQEPEDTPSVHRGELNSSKSTQTESWDSRAVMRATSIATTFGGRA
jgi:hypothetical protein